MKFTWRPLRNKGWKLIGPGGEVGVCLRVGDRFLALVGSEPDGPQSVGKTSRQAREIMESMLMAEARAFGIHVDFITEPYRVGA